MKIMKKTLIIISLLVAVNSFSAQVLNEKLSSVFKNQELRGLIFGHYNTDTEIAVVSKVSGVTQESLTKAENDAKVSLQSATKEYAYRILTGYLDGALVSGPGFNSSKMKEFSDEIAKKLADNAQKRGTWSTSKNETVVLYTIEKATIKSEATSVFGQRLDAVTQKLGEYKNTFDSLGNQ